MVTRSARYGSPAAVRQAARDGEIRTSTAPLAPGHAQATLVVPPRTLAYDFLVFAQRNPRPCPVLEALDCGDPVPRGLAPQSQPVASAPRSVGRVAPHPRA